MEFLLNIDYVWYMQVLIAMSLYGMFAAPLYALFTGNSQMVEFNMVFVTIKIRTTENRDFGVIISPLNV